MPKKLSKKRKPRSKITPHSGIKPGVGMIFWGISLVLIFSFYRIYSLQILSFGRPDQAIATTGPSPIKIEIPQVNLSLKVTPATVTDGTWEISPDGASHWNNSANPGDSGNIVIYAHNKTNLFGPIRWLDLGKEIIVTDTNDHQHRYLITETATVSPDQVDYIQPKNEETLTLYTCTGLFDRQRYVVIAKPNENTYLPDNR